MEKARTVSWLVAIGLYGIGDVASTIALLELGMAQGEGNPIAAAAIESVGLWVLVPWKIGALAFFFVVYRLVSERVSSYVAIGVPIGLATVGAILVAWNLGGGLILGRNPIPIF